MIDDDDIDRFLAQCGTSRAPTALPTPHKELPFNYRRKLSTADLGTTPQFSVGGSVLQGLQAGFSACRTIGDCRYVIKEVEQAHGDVSDSDVTYAARKANLTPLKDTSGRWTYGDTSRLRGS